MTNNNALNLQNNNLLFSNQGTAGIVFYMTVDENHSHENSSENSVSTIETFIDQITLEDKVGKKEKKIAKTTSKKAAPANWTKAQLAGLVELLKRYGSDFGLIATKIAKTREQIKRKFKVLEKKYPHLANAIFQRESNTLGLIQQDEFLNQ